MYVLYIHVSHPHADTICCDDHQPEHALRSTSLTSFALLLVCVHLLVCHFQLDVAKVLLLAGADSHARDHRSRCPLHMAALSGNSELVSSLLACGADPNKASDVGTTALHNAVSS